MPSTRKVSIESISDEENDPIMRDRLEIAGAKGYIDLDRDATELTFALRDQHPRWRKEFVVGPPGGTSDNSRAWSSITKTQKIESTTLPGNKNEDTGIGDYTSSNFTDIISGSNLGGSGTGVSPQPRRK